MSEDYPVSEVYEISRIRDSYTLEAIEKDAIVVGGTVEKYRSTVNTKWKNNVVFGGKRVYEWESALRRMASTICNEVNNIIVTKAVGELGEFIRIEKDLEKRLRSKNLSNSATTSESAQVVATA
tara:strand:- start:213 stop:584 length:372 start_codon:yes stop_codon:yes gene_type:complete